MYIYGLPKGKYGGTQEDQEAGSLLPEWTNGGSTRKDQGSDQATSTTQKNKTKSNENKT